MRRKAPGERDGSGHASGRAERIGRPDRYGVEAEIERLMRCPECGGSSVRQVRQPAGSYGFFGFKALGDFGAPRDVACRSCGFEWSRPPLRELRREAERRIDERYDRLEAENRRLRETLARLPQEKAAAWYDNDWYRPVEGSAEPGEPDAGCRLGSDGPGAH